MRTMNLTLNVLMAVILAAGLTACGSKKGKGTTAATPGSSCTYNYQYGTYVDSQGRSCQNYSGQSCQAQGLRYDSYYRAWFNASNQQVSCNDGGQWGSGGYVPYNGQYGGYNVNGCSGWYQIYGVQYIPINVGNGQMVCANSQWLSQYYGYNYGGYSQNYWDNNPMDAWSQYDDGYYGGYGGGYGNYSNCSTQIGISFSNWNMGAGGYLCF